MTHHHISFVVLLLAVTGCLAQEAPSGKQILSTLRPGHPRLICLNEDLARVRAMIAAEPLAAEYRDAIRKHAERILNEPPVEHKLAGPRLLGQSRRCLDRVYTLAFMYRLEGDRRYADRAIREMLTAAAFPDWNPNHFLDTAEMSHALGIGYDWLYDVMTEQQRTTIRQALVSLGLTPARLSYEGKQRYGWWRRSHHNWNQVCNGGIGIGALAIADEEPELAEYLLSQGLESIKLALSQYAPDGGWAEGPGYWHYATRYTCYFLAALHSALGTDFGLSGTPGFSKAGLFRVYFAGPVGKTFNFADAGDRVGRAEEMFWLARRFDEPLYAWHQRHCGGRPHALDLIWFDPRGKGPRESGLPLDAFFRGVDVAFFRSAWEDDEAIFIGFKGGDNRANHSHLDLGTFVLDALGKRWVLDLGGDNYNLPGYFGKNRWTYYRLRTEGHNTLLINGDNQDPRARAPIIAFLSEADRAFAVADLSQAYAAHARRVWRGIALLRRAHVLIQDEVEADEPVEVLAGMHTGAQINPNGAQATLSLGDARLRATILEPANASFEVASANPPRPQAQQPDVHRLVVRLPEKVTSTRIVVLLTPHGAGAAPTPYRPDIVALERWVQEAKAR